MNISISNMLATGAWMAFLSVLAIIGIIVAGGFIVAVIGRMVLNLLNSNAKDVAQVNNETEYAYVNTQGSQTEYVMQNEEHLTQEVAEQQSNEPELDYAYALDVDNSKAKDEEDELNKELNKSNMDDTDDFFKDFEGDNDIRFGDDDLLDMIDEISQDVLDEEEQNNLQTEQEESQANKSVLDNYSIDNFFNSEDSEEDEIEAIDEEMEQTEIIETIEDVVDGQIINEINALKDQAKEIVENMEDNKKQNETFNEQLVRILNELRVANNKEIKDVEEAKNQINGLSNKLDETQNQVQEQVVEQMVDTTEDIQARLQEQLDESKAEIEILKSRLNELVEKIEEPVADEVVPDEEVDEITALRNEVKEMLDSMREENDVKNSEFNAQLLEILNEMKDATLRNSEQVKVETADEAVAEINEWQEELKLTEKEINKQFNEQLIHKDQEEKDEIRSQMATYNDEISSLKAQLAELVERFKQESESTKAENQALIDQLERERQQRIHLEQEKLENEKIQKEQMDSLRKENEELADKLQARADGDYEPLTEEEMEDLYSNATIIDYSAISQMNEAQISERVKHGLEQSKAEIDALKEQVSRLTAYIEKHDEELAGKINVHEVRSADFDVEQIKEITAQEVETRVKEKLVDSLVEVEVLKDELAETKEEIEKQYKDQLANTDAGMEYDRVSKLQISAEKIDILNNQLNELIEVLQSEQTKIKNTSEECIAEIETSRESKTEEVKQNGLDAEVAVIGPKTNKIALVSSDEVQAEIVENIDIETAKKLTEAEIDEIVEARLQDSNKEIASLKQQIADLKQDLIAKDEEIEKAQAEQTTVPVVRSPLFDVEAIKRITAQEVEAKVQERLVEAMKEIEEMRNQLEASKKEIEKQYKEQVAKTEGIEPEVKDRLKDSAAEVIELKEQLADLTEQIEIEHQEAKQNSEMIAEQLEQDRKEKEEIAKQLVFNQENTDMAITTTTEVTVIGPKNNQVALVTGVPATSEEVDDDIPTIDIETVKKLAEEEIEEKVEQRMTSSIIEIEELKKQILNLSIQIQEIKKGNPDNDDEKPVVFHYSTEEAYLERIAILEERLKSAKKDLKVNNKELKPLQKVNRTLERDRIKLRRRDAIAAKKKVALYGVNNYVDIDREKAEKLAQELEMLDGLRLSVSHCEEVMNANIDRYPILVHTDKILRENISNIETDIATLNRELQALREKNGTDAE